MTPARPAAPAATPGKRILVVEDELMIRMLLEDMLGELGYTIAAEAGRMDEALQAAKNAEFDLAILDVNLNGETTAPVAEALAARGSGRGIPFCEALMRGSFGAFFAREAEREKEDKAGSVLVTPDDIRAEQARARSRSPRR